ncbi:9622_t:CDS:2, partial [Dentiscutata heterogama]
NGYGNLHVSAAYPQRNTTGLALNSNNISITYRDPIELSNGNLYIYQQINDQKRILRQIISADACSIDKGCTVSGNTIALQVLDCTFNNPSAQYYIEVDNSFIRSSEYKEPILGIQNMWQFYTVEQTPSQKHAGDIYAVLRLTDDGSQYFSGLNSSAKENFFATLIKELTIIIPTENGRLDTNQHYQYDSSSKVYLSITIYAAKGNNKLITTEILNNLDQLIRNKKYTSISTETTTQYLDETFGVSKYQTIQEYFEVHKSRFIIVFVVIVAFALLFLVARQISNESIPSLWVPRPFVRWFAHNGRVAVSFALLSGANIDTLLILRSRVMNLKMFNAPFSDRSLKTIFWGACIGVFLTDIPQFIIQIIYLLSSVVIDVTSIFAVVASGLSIVASLTSKFFFILYGAQSPYLKRFMVDESTTEIEKIDPTNINDGK